MYNLYCILCDLKNNKIPEKKNQIIKLIRIQHEKKHGKGSKNILAYFDNKMIEEEEMERQIDDGTFDECAYSQFWKMSCKYMQIYLDKYTQLMSRMMMDDDLCAYVLYL